MEDIKKLYNKVKNLDELNEDMWDIIDDEDVIYELLEYGKLKPTLLKEIIENAAYYPVIVEATNCLYEQKGITLEYIESIYGNNYAFIAVIFAYKQELSLKQVWKLFYKYKDLVSDEIVTDMCDIIDDKMEELK